jgi:hypothetical protein
MGSTSYYLAGRYLLELALLCLSFINYIHMFSGATEFTHHLSHDDFSAETISDVISEVIDELERTWKEVIVV